MLYLRDLEKNASKWYTSGWRKCIILCIIELQDTENECIIQARNSPKKSFLFRIYKEVFLEVRLIKRRF